MTDLSYTPDPTDALAPFPYLESGSTTDRKLLWMAVIVAFALHLGAALISLPERSRPDVIRDIPPRVTSLAKLTLPPPRRPTDQPREFQQPLRRLPVPVDSPPVIDQLVNAQEPESITLAADIHLSGAILAPEYVDPGAAVHPEGTAGLILPVALPGRLTPEYPRIAVFSGSEGEVLLQAIIGVDGSVESIEVIKAPIPDLGFSQAAIEAVSHWKYQPGMLKNRPVAVRLTVLVAFNLN